MPHVPDTVTDPVLRARLSGLRRRLEEGLRSADPHQRLIGRPVCYRVISGHTLEIEYRDVPRAGDTELNGVKRLLGEGTFSVVSPQTAETISVKFIVPLADGE